MSSDKLLKDLGKVARDPPEPESPCPSDEALRHFQAQMAQGKEVVETEAHLAECARCVDRLLTLEHKVPELSAATRRHILSASARGVSKRRRWFMAPQWMAGALAASAAAILLVTLPRGGPPPLPEYAFHLSGQVMEARGDPPAPASRDEVPVFLPSSEMVIAASPKLAGPEQSPSVAIFLEDSSGRTQRVEPEVETDGETGAVAVRLAIGALLGDHYGTYRISALLVPHGEDPPEGPDSGDDASPTGSRLFSAYFDYRSPE